MKSNNQFLYGMGSVLDLFGVLAPPVEIMSDKEALSNDWEKIGNDFRIVFNINGKKEKRK